MYSDVSTNNAKRLAKRALNDVNLISHTVHLGDAATLIAQGMPVERAVEAAMIEPLTDDEDVKRGLLDLVTAVFG